MSFELDELPTEQRGHVVHFYLSDDELVRVVADHFLPVLGQGGAALLVATLEHRRALESELTAAGVDVAAATRDGRYTALDARGVLSRFLVGGSPDPETFDQVVGDVVERCRRPGRPLAVFGEMVAELWDEGNIDGAVILEDLWNALGERLDFSLLCAYPTAAVGNRVHDHSRVQVCRLHSAVVGFPEREVYRRFACSPEAPRQARQFVQQAFLHRSQRGAIDDALLVVSELATNAVIHAATEFTVRLVPDGELVRIEVADTSPIVPAERRLPGVEPSGRGLGLVSTVSRRWGFESDEDGKTIWAEVPVDPWNPSN